MFSYDPLVSVDQFRDEDQRVIAGWVSALEKHVLNKYLDLRLALFFCSKQFFLGFTIVLNFDVHLNKTCAFVS